jgi:hypothetical protein
MSAMTIQLEHPRRYMLACCILGGISLFHVKSMEKLATSKQYHEQVKKKSSDTARKFTRKALYLFFLSIVKVEATERTLR